MRFGPALACCTLGLLLCWICILPCLISTQRITVRRCARCVPVRRLLLRPASWLSLNRRAGSRQLRQSLTLWYKQYVKTYFGEICEITYIKYVNVVCEIYIFLRYIFRKITFGVVTFSNGIQISKEYIRIPNGYISIRVLKVVKFR